MKNILFYLTFGFIFIVSSCTSDFDEINTKPDSFTADDASAKFFVTNTQVAFFCSK